jgi:hypothetical protein
MSFAVCRLQTCQRSTEVRSRPHEFIPVSTVLCDIYSGQGQELILYLYLTAGHLICIMAAHEKVIANISDHTQRYFLW